MSCRWTNEELKERAESNDESEAELARTLLEARGVERYRNQ